jgi:surface antigen Omp85-like protein
MMSELVTRKSPRLASRLGALLVCLASSDMAIAQDAQSGAPSDQPPPPIASSPPPINAGLLPEPQLLTKGINVAVDMFGDGGKARDGLYLELSNMVIGSGFVSLGPGYRHYLFGRRALVDVSTALSWHLYKMAQGRFEVPDLAKGHLTLGSQFMWQDQTQVHYFGVGSNSLEDNESQYRMKHTDLVGFITVQPYDWLAIGGEFGWLSRPNILPPAGTFQPDLPDASVQFPLDPGVSASVQPNFLHGEASLIADTRDHPGHPTGGGLFRAAVTTYSDQSGGTFSFRQYEAEASRFVPLAGKNWLLAFRGWFLASDVPVGRDVPFYLLPSLGGHDTLRGYSDYRFHDRNLVVVNAESRWAIFSSLDGALFIDAGNVAARVGDLNLRKVDYGAGLRLHSERATFARLDVAYGDEGWKLSLRTSDPFRLARLASRVARVPFAP